MTKDKTQIGILDSRSLPVRLGLAGLILFALVFGWFSVRWQLGNMLAELTVPNESNAREIAALALSLSPGDPIANWLFAGTKKK